MEEGVKEWFERAESDHKLAEDNLEMGNDSAAMFFCHQALEKAMKAFEIEESGEKSFSHNLVVLYRELDEEELEQYEALFADLNPFYTGFRYPDEESPMIENPEKKVEHTGEVLQWMKKRLRK